MIMNNEKGQTLPLVLLAMAIGSLLVTPFLGHAGSNLIGSRTYRQAIMEQYSGDAGIDHGIWNLIYGGLDGQVPSPGDSVSYPLNETVNNIAPTISVTCTAPNTFIGDITDPVLSTLEFDTTDGANPDIIHISGNVYAIAYQGPGSDGFLKTVTIATNGSITQTVIDTLEFDTSNGSYPDIVHIAEDVYAIAYMGPFSDGFLITVRIATDGRITQTVLDTLEFDTSDCSYPVIVPVSGNVYAIAYTGPFSNGFLKTVAIASALGATYDIVSTAGGNTIRATVHILGSAVSILSWVFSN